MIRFNFNDKVDIKEFTLINWEDKIAYRLGIRDCVKLAKKAISEGFENARWIVPVMNEVKSFRDTGGDVYTDAYQIIIAEDYEEHNGYMAYFNYSYSNWVNMTKEDFGTLERFIHATLKEEESCNQD